MSNFVLKLIAFLRQRKVPADTIGHRFIIGSKKIKDDGTVKSPKHFYNKKGELSVYLTDGYEDGEILDIARQHVMVGNNATRSLSGYATISIDFIRTIHWPEDNPRQTILDAKTFPYPHPLHANIIKCPREQHSKAVQIAVAHLIRQHATGVKLT